jgi:hypothetical protein
MTLCYFCRTEIVVSTKKRTNHTYSAHCDTCGYVHAISQSGEIRNIQRRFSYHGVKWHLTYRPVIDLSTFVQVAKVKTAVYNVETDLRIKHYFDGFLSPERFQKLLAFL